MSSNLSGSKYSPNSSSLTANTTPQTLVVPFLFTNTASGAETLSVWADNIVASISASYVVNLSVAATTLNTSAFFSFVNDWSSANGSSNLHLPYNLQMNFSALALAPEVARFDASFEAVPTVGVPHPPRSVKDSAAASIVTPYGDWRNWVEDPVWKAINSNTEVLSKEKTSFTDLPLFSGSNYVLQLSDATGSNVSNALQAFYDVASYKGKLYGTSLSSGDLSANIDESGAYTSNIIGNLSLASNDTVTVYVKYARSYNLSYEVNSTNPLSNLYSNTVTASGDVGATAFSMLIGNAIASLVDRSVSSGDSNPLVYQFNFNAV